MPGAPLIPKIPPLRTDIQEPQQSSAVNRPPAQGASNGANTASNGGPQHRTSKEWYYYWSKVGEQVVQNTQTLAGLVTYGPHAGRPDPSTMPDGALAVESDRGAIYQNELIQGTPAWRYVAGTMWGTVSPDTRPTDLGVHDAGFEFRTTDQPPRVFVWSGGAWVETTPVRYGLHSARLAQPVANLWEGALWVETDRGNVIYELQDAGVWHYVAGTMHGTMSPDQRPTDLGSNDTGFQFRSTDSPPRQFIWAGTVWQEVTPERNTVQLAYATGSLTLTTTPAAIPGAQLSLALAGRYLIIGVFDMAAGGAGDTNQNLIGQLSADGVLQGPLAAMTPGGSFDRGTVAQQWLFTASAAGKIVALYAYKSGGTAGSLAAGNSSISAFWIGA